MNLLKKKSDYRLHPLRLSKKDYDKLTRSSCNTGLTKSDFLRKLINQQEIKSKPPDTYYNLVKEISTIGNTINILVQTTDKLDIEQAETVVLLLEKIFEKLNEMG